MSGDWLTPTPAPVGNGKRKLGRALGMSIVAHTGMLMLVLIAMSVRPTPVDTKESPIKLNAVYIPIAGSMGGGGGHRDPASAKEVEVPHHELPRPAPVDPQPARPDPPPNPFPVIDVAIETDAANLLRAAGTAVNSLTPGGLGRNGGSGPGDGPGVGPGRNGNVGDGPRRPGGDVTMPTLIRSVDPVYTPDALAAKTSGTVELEVVVLPNGTVGQIRVIKSLDAVHGLDQEAIKAARQWLFRPSTLQGKPVEVLVTLILDFHIR